MQKQNTVLKTIISNFDLMCKQHFIDWFKENKNVLLEAEKQQIENSFDEGYEEKYQQEINSENPFYQNGLDYYSKTFKND